jgi:phosphodiesterase/alkaline phosphatase D-like protein
MLPKKTFSCMFFMLLMLFVFLLSFSSTPLSAVALGTNGEPDHITLTWASDSRTTQTITWRTDVATKTGQVQYSEAADSKLSVHNTRSVAAQVEELATNLGNMNIHSVTLTGLKPGIRYSYQIGDGSTWSAPHTFTTAPPRDQGFKFLIFGDSQSVNYGTWGTTLHQAYQANLDAAFLTNVGDLVDMGQDYSQWNLWFSAAQGVIDTIPVMPVIGNHEAYAPGGHFSMPTFYTAQFKLPSNGPESIKGQVYSFDYGDVHFSVLDSQEGEERQFVPEMLMMQKVWLEKDLQSTNKKWKVVLLHRPLYNNRISGNDSNIRMAFLPIIDKYHVDVVFTGHEHVYAHTYPLNNDRVVDSPAKGTVYVAVGRSGSKTYKNMSTKELNEFLYNPLDEPNYLTAQVQGDILTVSAFKQSGVLIDTWIINKAVGRTQ